MAGLTDDGAVVITARPAAGVPAGTPVQGGVARTNDGAVYVTGAGIGPGGTIERPTGFGFDFAAFFPYQFVRAANGQVYVPGFDETSLIPYDCLNATQYYVDINAANDTNDGSTWALAKKGIDAMLAAATYPCIINVRGGITPTLYDAVNSWNGTTPGGSCWIRAVGGRAISASCWATAISITLDTGTTYTATRSNVVRVLDRTNLDADGQWTELAYVATLTECRATPGTWTNNSLNVSVWINRSDGAAVTTTNTMVLLSSTTNGKSPTSGDIYVSGIDFVGGNNAAFRCDGNLTGRGAFVDCGFKWAGRASSTTDGFQALDFACAYLIRCNASGNSKDGFGCPTGSVSSIVLIDCVGFTNGMSPETGCNALTLHSGTKGISLRGVWGKSYGPNVAIINTNTHLWCIQDVSRDSYGDVPNGGSTVGTNWASFTEAQLWLESCAGGGTSEREFTATSPAAIFKRNHSSEAGITAGDGVTDY